MDEADRADLEIEQTLDYLIENASRPIPDGQPGSCDICGEYYKRLVNSHCARCRDEFKLP